MVLAPDAVALIRESWATLSRDPDALAARFFDELFAAAPELRALFAGADLDAHRRKLTAALDLVVRRAADLGPLVPGLVDLGRRHLRHGVRDEHYALVTRALIRAIAVRLGEAFRPDVRDAWLTALDALSGVMRAGAATGYRASPPARRSAARGHAS